MGKTQLKSVHISEWNQSFHDCQQENKKKKFFKSGFELIYKGI